MIADTLLLLRLYWTIDRRADSGTRRSSRIIMIVGALIAAAISWALGSFAATFVSESSLIQIRAEILPGLVFTIIMFVVVFIGFGQGLQALYLSDDLEKLWVAPIRPEAIMTAKLLSRVPSTIFILFLATIPMLIAFGIGLNMGLSYYILGVFLILITPLFGISLGALIAIFLVRLLPARRLNEWVGAASIIIGMLITLLFTAPSFLSRSSQQIGTDVLENAEAFINHLGNLPLPSIWVGKALVEFGRGQMAASAFGALGVYLLITIGLFLGTIFLANRLFSTGWMRMQSAGSATADIHEQPGMFGRHSLDFTLGFKDWLLRIRDPRLLATLFTSLIMAGFLAVMLLAPQKDGSSLFGITDGMEINILSAGVIVSGLIYFLGWLAFSNLALTTLSIERTAFYILKTAPISPSQLFRAKTFSIFIPYAVLATIGLLVGLFVLKLSLIWLPFGWLTLMIMGYGMFSFIVSIGFRYPNLEWEDPRRIKNNKAILPSMLGSVGYSIIAVIVVISTYFFALSESHLAIPIVIFGLSLLAGGTWFFVHRSTERVEKAWAAIGVR